MCQKNLEICVEFYGDESIFLVKPLFTLYTAKIQES
jgi:hypothetical protein